MYNLQELYPVLQQCTYLNTAAHGLLSTELAAYKNELNDRMLVEASNFTDRRDELINEVRSTVSQFLDSEYRLTALVPNFSLAFNALIAGIDPNAKFLLVSGDYPSINHAVEARGYQCVYADLNVDLEKNIWEACEKHHPDFLALSIVQYISGIKIDLDFLKDLKVQFPDLIVIADGTQYVGVEEFRFRESGIDILAASCYKWLNAGNGNGFIVFKEQVVERVQPKFTNSIVPGSFSNDRGTFIGYFEPGHQDIIAFQGLKRAVEFVNEYGLLRMEIDIKRLSKRAFEEFAKRDLLTNDVTGRKVHSSIFNITGSDELFQNLSEHKIITSKRGAGIRVSFSYYNSTHELQQLLTILDNANH